MFLDGLILDTYFVSRLQIQLGARIRELRDLAGMSREEYSAKVSLSARRIASLELGRGWPRPAALERIAKSFRLDVRDLFDFSSSRELPRKNL
jgi:transcriptional regulator with XRE-family HTH domain